MVTTRDEAGLFSEVEFDIENEVVRDALEIRETFARSEGAEGMIFAELVEFFVNSTLPAIFVREAVLFIQEEGVGHAAGNFFAELVFRGFRVGIGLVNMGQSGVGGVEVESPPERRVVVEAVLGDVCEDKVRGLEAEGIAINPSTLGVIPFPCNVKAKTWRGCLGLVGDNACRGPEREVRVVGIREGVHVLNVFELVQLPPGVVIAWEAGWPRIGSGRWRVDAGWNLG